MKKKVALVTGGARGIGAAVVKRFLKDGIKVYFTYHASQTRAEELAKSLGSPNDLAFFRCDVRKRQEAQKTVEKVLEKEEQLDILVNNAGIIKDGLFLMMDDEDWQDVLNTNLGGVFNFTKPVVKHMFSKRSGRIINISSIVGELGGFGQANYAASKGAINAFTKSLAAEFSSRNITVNAVAPGMVSTEMSEAVRSHFGDKIKERIPVGYFAEPEDVASVVGFLASEEARYITGQVITVDGGISLLGRK